MTQCKSQKVMTHLTEHEQNQRMLDNQQLNSVGPYKILYC